MNIKDLENKIINDDCLNILKQLPDKSIDLVLTDPPYGIGRFGNRVEISNRIACTAKINKWDKKPSQELFNEIFRVSKNQIIFGANNFTLPESEYFLVWNKMQTVDNFASAELAYTNMKIPAKVFNYSIHQVMQDRKKQGGKSHPTEKPVKLMEWCILLADKFIDKNGIILDCFSGSGTMAIACHNLNRRFICIEKDYDYWKASVERLENAKSQLNLFTNIEQPKEEITEQAKLF